MKHLLQLRFLLLALCSFSVFACGGKTGPQGPAGSNGNSGKIVATMNCSGYISGLSGQAGTALNGLKVDYDAVLTSIGDVYASASISDDIAQVSGTKFYASGQSGASNGNVEIIADFHGTSDAGKWSISLNRSTLITTVVYTDASLGGPVSLDFTAAACSQSYF